MITTFLLPIIDIFFCYIPEEREAKKGNDNNNNNNENIRYYSPPLQFRDASIKETSNSIESDSNEAEFLSWDKTRITLVY